MLTFFLLVAALGVSLPDAASVPSIEVGQVVETVSVDGAQWIRILESDYAVLEVSSKTSVPLYAFNSNGEVLAFSTAGEPLSLSAYSDYWFWIRAGGNSPVEISVEYLDAETISERGASSSLSYAQMAEIYTFTAPEEGDWSILMRGTDEISDLDLEIYSTNYAVLTRSLSGNSSEKVNIGLLAGEEVFIVVSRYNKGGNGEYSLEIARKGEMEPLTGTITADAISGDVQRYRIPPLESDILLELTYELEGDLDIIVRDQTGDLLYSSTTYLFTEALLLPAGSSAAVLEVIPYDLGEDLESFPYTVNMTPSAHNLAQGQTFNTETGYGSSVLCRFSVPSSGFYTISAVFDKSRDGDLRVFNDYGEPAVFMMTDRGEESCNIWADQSDHLWISPCFTSGLSGGDCELTVTPTDAEYVSGTVHGRIDDTTASQQFYTVRGEAGSTLVVEIQGDQRDFDLDMLVSGPGYILQAEGGVSNTDNAADESVALYCEEDGVYGVTVYAYERRGQGTFTIDAEIIPSEVLSSGSNSSETWAVVAGISGYETRADILSRASMDAIDFYRFLRDDQAIDSDHIVLLVDAEARSDVFRNSVSDICSRAGSEDKLILFYSGHGSQLPPGSGGSEEPDGVDEVLCFYNEDISDDEMKELLEDFPGSVYLFADACNSGGFVNDFDENDNILVLTAAREDKSVSERVLTPILLEGSRGAADSNGNGVITAGELHSYVDGMLARICPVCDSVVNDGMIECPECGTVLKGEYRIPRPEQGLFLDPDQPLWH